MKNKTVRVKTTELLFGCCIILFMSSVVFEFTAWASRSSHTLNLVAYILKGMRYVAYSISLVCILRKRYYHKEGICIVALGMIVMSIVAFASYNKTLFLYMFIFWAAMSVSGTFTIKCTLTVQILIWSATLFCTIIGILPDLYQIQGERIRHYLGFNYTTTAPTLFYYMLLQFIFLKKGKIKLKEYLVFMLIAFFFYIATRSRMIFAMSVLTLTFFLFYEKLFSKGRLLKQLKLAVVFFPFLAMAVSIWAAASYDGTNAVWASLNVLLNNRLRLANDGLRSYGIHLFGQEIEWIGSNIQSLLHGLRGAYNFVDCSYLHLLYESGIMGVFCITAAYSCLLRRAIVQRQYYLVWILLFVTFHAIVEPFLIEIAFNPFLLLLMTKPEEEPAYQKLNDADKNVFLNTKPRIG